MNKKILKIIKLMFVGLILIGHFSCGKTDTEYLSFIVTKGSIIHTFKYDPKSGEVKEIAKIVNNSQYPVEVYDESVNAIYFSKREGESHCDQLWIYDVINNTYQRLTDDIYAISYIIPRGDSLYLVAVPRGGYCVLNLFIYDKVNGTLENISPDLNFTIQKAYYDPRTDQLLVSGYDFIEDTKRLDEQSEENPYIPCKNDIYLVEDGKFTYLFSTSEHEMGKIVMHDDEVIYSVNEIENPYQTDLTNYVSFSYDLANKTHSLAKLPIFDSDLSMRKIVYYSGDDFYYIGSNKRCVAKLVYVNLKTNKEKVIYEIGLGLQATISSVHMVSYDHQ